MKNWQQCKNIWLFRFEFRIASPSNTCSKKIFSLTVGVIVWRKGKGIIDAYIRVAAIRILHFCKHHPPHNHTMSKIHNTTQSNPSWLVGLVDDECRLLSVCWVVLCRLLSRLGPLLLIAYLVPFGLRLHFMWSKQSADTVQINPERRPNRGTVRYMQLQYALVNTHARNKQSRIKWFFCNFHYFTASANCNQCNSAEQIAPFHSFINESKCNRLVVYCCWYLSDYSRAKLNVTFLKEYK